MGRVPNREREDEEQDVEQDVKIKEAKDYEYANPEIMSPFAFPFAFKTPPSEGEVGESHRKSLFSSPSPFSFESPADANEFVKLT